MQYIASGDRPNRNQHKETCFSLSAPYKLLANSDIHRWGSLIKAVNINDFSGWLSTTSIFTRLTRAKLTGLCRSHADLSYIFSVWCSEPVLL